MKLSKYTIITRKGFNKYIVHNMVSKATIIMTKSEVKRLKNLNMTLEEANQMLELGLFIDDNKDELKEILQENRETCDDMQTLNVTLIPTFACNLSCAYCYQNGLKLDIIDDLSLNGFIKFVKQRLEETNAINFHLSWFGGEPLLVFDKIKETNKEFITYCNDKDIKFTSSIATNVTLLNEQMLAEMQSLNIERIETTLAGNEKCHNILRVPNDKDMNSYKQTMQGIKLATSKFITMININFCKDNAKSIKKLLKELTKYNNKNLYINFNEIMNYTQNRRQIKEYKEVENFKLKMFNYALKLNLKICDTTNFCKEAIYCPQWHKNSFAIDNKLNVYKCTELFDEETKIGYINPDNGKMVIQKEIKSYIHDNCKKCKYLPYCNGGCVMKRIQNKSPCPTELGSVLRYLKLFVKRTEHTEGQG